MKKPLFLIFVFVLIIMLEGCENKNDEVAQSSVLKKSWTQSYEEKTSEEIEVYRPSNHIEFPLSRYRQFFKFEENSRCEYLVLAANDGHFEESGIWQYNEETKIITIFNSDSEAIYVFEVIELTDSLLRLKPIK